MCILRIWFNIINQDSSSEDHFGLFFPFSHFFFSSSLLLNCKTAGNFVCYWGHYVCHYKFGGDGQLWDQHHYVFISLYRLKEMPVLQLFLSPQHPQGNSSYSQSLPSLMYGLAGTKGFCAGMAWDSWRPLSDALMSCWWCCWMNWVLAGCSYCVTFKLWLEKYQNYHQRELQLGSKYFSLLRD